MVFGGRTGSAAAQPVYLQSCLVRRTLVRFIPSSPNPAISNTFMGSFAAISGRRSSCRGSCCCSSSWASRKSLQDCAASTALAHWLPGSSKTDVYQRAAGRWRGGLEVHGNANLAAPVAHPAGQFEQSSQNMGGIVVHAYALFAYRIPGLCGRRLSSAESGGVSTSTCTEIFVAVFFYFFPSGSTSSMSIM